MVYGTYSSEDPNVSADTFVEGSALLWENPGYLTENDVIKVLIDNSTVSSNQTYYKATNVDHETSSCDWTKIGSLEPYYSTWVIDDKFTDAYEYLDDNFLKADNTAVSGGHNIVVDKPSENIPAVRIQTSSHVTFTGVSSTDLSATNASGTNLNYSKVSATNLSSTTISATTASGQSAIFTGVSAQGLTATDFNVDNIKAKNVSASESFSGKKITIETSAKIPGISATNISSKTFTISGADGTRTESVSSTQDTIQLIEKYPGTYTYTTKITPKSYSAEYSIGGGGGCVCYDYSHVFASSYGENTASITWINLIKAGNGDFKGTDVTAQSFNTSSDDPGYGIVNLYTTDWGGAGAGGADASGSAGLNGCVVWSDASYTAHNNPDNVNGNWATWNDIIHAANSTWVSSNGSITAIASGTVGAATGVLYFV